MSDLGGGPAPKPVTKEDFLINDLISNRPDDKWSMIVGSILLHILQKLNVPKQENLK